MNEEIMRKLGFGKEVDATKQNKCPICGETIVLDNFKNSLSRKEFQISGMCQSCQDKTFGED